MRSRSTARHWRPILVLAATLGLTGVTVAYSVVNATAKDLARFENRLQRTEDLIRSRLDTYVVLLQSWAFQFASETPVRPVDCLALIKRLDLERGYPGIAKLGFSPRVRKGESQVLAKWLSAIGRTELPMQSDDRRDEAFPIVILEPHEVGQPLVGYDPSGAPAMRDVVDRARDEGVPAASQKVDLGFGTAALQDPGFLIYVPVYRAGVVPDTVAARREALEGFVHGSFRLTGLLAKLFQSETQHGIGFEIYSGTEPGEEKLLFRSFDASDGAVSPSFSKTLGMDVAGQPWVVNYRTIPPFAEGSEKGQAFIVLLLGLAASGALFFSAWSQERGSAMLRGSEERVRDLNLSLESRVRDRTAELEAANKALEAFSYSVSHDLRGPLRSLDGFSQILVDRYAPGMDEQGRNYLERVLAAAKEMSLLIDGFLSLARVSRREMKQELVDLSVMAAAIGWELRSRDADRQATFIVQPGVVAKGDSQLLRIVLGNLLENAWKFTVKKTEARIEFGTVPCAGETACFVKDNGAGFDMSLADRLFRPFERIHNSTDYPGTGIGLATVQRSIERHAGRVWAEGSTEGGATFFFTLGYGIETRAGLPDGSGAATTTHQEEHHA